MAAILSWPQCVNIGSGNEWLDAIMLQSIIWTGVHQEP